jgi:hypothetical protein
MSNNLIHARAIAAWCMSMFTLGAWGIVSGAPLTTANGMLLFAACAVPPLVMLLVWRQPAPIALGETL